MSCYFQDSTYEATSNNSNVNHISVVFLSYYYFTAYSTY